MGIKEVCDKYGLQNQHQVIDLLGLMGDASDNIPGCKGVGEKTAVALLQQFGSIDNNNRNKAIIWHLQKKTLWNCSKVLKDIIRG